MMLFEQFKGVGYLDRAGEHGRVTFLEPAASYSEVEIRLIVEGYFNAWAKRDWKTLANYFSSTAKIDSDWFKKRQITVAEYISLLKQIDHMLIAAKLEEGRISLNADSAEVNGTLAIVYQKPKFGQFTLGRKFSLVKQNGLWKIERQITYEWSKIHERI